METSEETYIRCEAASGFKMGDRVKCTGTASNHQFGWRNSWVSPEMDMAVGKVGTIESIAISGNGISINFDESEVNNNCQYPFFVLEKIADAVVKPPDSGFQPYSSRRGRSGGLLTGTGGFAAGEELDKLFSELRSLRMRGAEKEKEKRREDNTPPPDITMV